MSEHVTPPLVLIPETAPFDPDQRAWLSGYFAALLGPSVAGATALAPGDAPATGPKLADIVKAVNAIGASPADLVAILEALKEAGALKAELIIL